MAPSEVTRFRSGTEGDIGVNYIEHHVSKLDTLAGVAIKYGVEVADIKRMNGLVTDLQMFALKMLRVPLPGRHPPSSNMDDRTNKIPPCICRSKPPQPKVPQAIDILQKHYDLRSSNSRSNLEETEMTVYRSSSKYLPKSSTIFEKFPNNYNKSRYVADGLLDQIDTIEGEAEKSDEGSIRRRQKADAGCGNGLYEELLMEESSDETRQFSYSTGKDSASKQKPVRRVLGHTESDGAWLDSIVVGLGDSIFSDAWSAIQRCSSLSSVNEQEKSNSAIVWPPTNWSLMTDLQALSASAITKPIFDGITIPIAGCKIKAAMD